jgi:hypothetical protein
MLSRETIIEENGDSDGEGSEAGNNFKVGYPRSVCSFRGDRAGYDCFLVFAHGSRQSSPLPHIIVSKQLQALFACVDLKKWAAMPDTFGLSANRSVLQAFLH